MKAWKLLILILSLTLVMPLAAQADDTLDAIQQGLDYYKNGKFTKAIGELEFALTQLRQKKGEAVEKLMPEAPDGWSVNKDDSGTSAGGAGMFGGGINVSRSYRQTDGKGQVKIEVISDSPMLQGMAAMFSNPAFVQGGKGAKLIRFQGEKAILTSKRDDRAELQMILNGKMMFKVSVNRVAGAADLAKKFGQMVDLDKLSEFAK